MKRIIYILSILVFLLPVCVQSQMVIFYRYRPVIYEISHRSIVIYDKDNQKVGLIPQISFIGEPGDFCVVVPTPTEPKLNTVSKDVFYDAERLTDSIWRERGSGCFNSDILGGAEETESSSPDSGVEIIGEQTVGVFDTVTFSATDPDSMISWLQENGYKYSVQDKDIIDYYIKRGWVFTAMKIDASSKSDKYYYDRYNINPILFRYSANSLIYPIRLASINSGDRTDIVTYVLSDSKMSFPGAKVEYANKIDEKEMEEILDRYPAFGGLIGQSRYLTKLKRTFSIMEMDADIEIAPTTSDTEFRKVIYYGVSPAMDFFPLGIVAILFLAFRWLKERKRNAQ